MLDVALLGTGGTMPLPGRWLSATLLRLQGRLVLFDCGEGTQIAMKLLGWGFRTLDALFVTHFHADHVAGLPGILLMVAHAGRTEPLDIYGPPGLERVVAALRVVVPHLPYEVQCHELSSAETVTVSKLEVRSLGVDHEVPCLAYAATLPRGRPFDPERARSLGVPVHLWQTLQRGYPVAWNGRRVEPDEVLGPARRGIKLALVTDTRPTPALPAFVAGADLLICEGMYGDPADLPRAVERKHMLFREAALLAREGRVDELWLTHYSPSLLDPAAFLDEARRIFPRTLAGRDLQTKTLRYPD